MFIDIPPNDINVIINIHFNILLFIVATEATPFVKSKKPFINTFIIGGAFKYFIIYADIKKKNREVPYIKIIVFIDELMALVK